VTLEDGTKAHFLVMELVEAEDLEGQGILRRDRRRDEIWRKLESSSNARTSGTCARLVESDRVPA